MPRQGRRHSVRSRRDYESTADAESTALRCSCSERIRLGTSHAAPLGASMKTSGILRVPALGHALSSPLLSSFRRNGASLPFGWSWWPFPKERPPGPLHLWQKCSGCAPLPCHSADAVCGTGGAAWLCGTPAGPCHLARASKTHRRAPEDGPRRKRLCTKHAECWGSTCSFARQPLTSPSCAAAHRTCSAESAQAWDGSGARGSHEGDAARSPR